MRVVLYVDPVLVELKWNSGDDEKLADVLLVREWAAAIFLYPSDPRPSNSRSRTSPHNGNGTSGAVTISFTPGHWCMHLDLPSNHNVIGGRLFPSTERDQTGIAFAPFSHPLPTPPKRESTNESLGKPRSMQRLRGNDDGQSPSGWLHYDSLN